MNWTTVQDAITASVDDKLESRCQDITTSLLAGLSQFDTGIKQYDHSDAEALAALTGLLDNISAWITTNNVLPSALQLGERVVTADRTIIRTQIESEVETNVGTHVETGVSDKYPDTAEA